MKNGVFKFYLLIVCFVTLIFSAISLSRGLHSMVTLLAPELTLNSYVYNQHQSIESYRQSMPVAGGHNPQAFLAAGPGGMPRPFFGVQSINSVGQQGTKEQKALSDSEIDILRLKSLNSAVANHRREALQSFINFAIIFFIAFSLFIVHWRMANKARRNET